LTTVLILDIVEYVIAPSRRQSTLFYAPLAAQASLLKDDLLEPIDGLLDDPQLAELVRRRLASRYPKSERTGRYAIAPDRLLRCCVLKHVKGWSFRELEREVRSNLVYRKFTRFDGDATPNYSTFSRTFALLGPEVTQAVHDRVVAKARTEGVAAGRKLRVDTTVVETNIHHPTDSTLLADGARVLTRLLRRIAKECQAGRVKVVDHARAVKRRVLEIHRAARSKQQSARERLKESYRKLVGLVKGVVRQAEAVLRPGALEVVGNAEKILFAQVGLEHYLPLVHQVVQQTEQRVFGGDNHAPGKILSLFEPHSQVIRKGKAHKPNEFGRLVRIDEVENGIVSQYAVLPGNQADTNGWLPALDAHQQHFDRAPRLATADRGFFSAHNEQEAKKRGVEKVALPAPGRLSQKRSDLQRERWFRRALRWRGGIEPRIGTLKNPFSMRRATYKEERGFERYVGWCVIANNVVSIARTLVRRRRTDASPDRR
jgi:IS5 family transposase